MIKLQRGPSVTLFFFLHIEEKLRTGKKKHRYITCNAWSRLEASNISTMQMTGCWFAASKHVLACFFGVKGSLKATQTAAPAEAHPALIPPGFIAPFLSVQAASEYLDLINIYLYRFHRMRSSQGMERLAEGDNNMSWPTTIRCDVRGLN